LCHRQAGSKQALLVEKRSKNFLTIGAGIAATARSLTEVFWFFFSKKNRLLARV
jgi:hypothetical protein